MCAEKVVSNKNNASRQVINIRVIWNHSEIMYTFGF